MRARRCRRTSLRWSATGNLADSLADGETRRRTSLGITRAGLAKRCVTWLKLLLTPGAQCAAQARAMREFVDALGLFPALFDSEPSARSRRARLTWLLTHDRRLDASTREAATALIEACEHLGVLLWPDTETRLTSVPAAERSGAERIMRLLSRAAGVLNAAHAHICHAVRRGRRAGSTPTRSRFKFQKLLQPFTLTRGSSRPSSGSLLDWLVLGVAIATLLVVESWWVRVFASLVAALWIARLFVIGHDACHGSYTPNKTLNKWIGRIAFLPSLTPYSLWEVGHNLAHHGFTNLKGRDYVWTPYSPNEFARLSWMRRRSGAHLSQRRRSGRLLHDRDVVEEAVFPEPQARRPRGASATPGTACW